MRDRLRRDKVFEAEDILQQVFAHDKARLGRVRAPDIVEDALKDLQQKRSGAAGKIEHSDAVIYRQVLP